ncbi:YcfL family protein [Campylobacter geochelonis]|uniref:Type IV secretion system putative lipoprotein virB7 n=1 Tax=Campylobacter geochelonis TaxID=1780362 RepID=A0A128EHB0_9BACT|nr:DUF1425 domain-containing protein [Campylobacter geochelonis]QKF71727.1 putative lipoprotein (DUF1425 domain) [Campylobacter geochelonis]CZE47643.1 lipoprotein [Campylobacter geochelonis]CZE48560.1 lipoprotein [Campylobacter geochelonis]CZE51145.1 lipoprotein [Campylobacter geochelonis]
MKKYIFSALAVLLLAGCGISPTERLAQHNVIIEDEDIMDDFDLVSVVSKTRDDGLSQAQAVLKNNTKKNQMIAYRVDWIDKDGFVKDTILSKWKVVQVEAKRDVVLNAISPSIDTVDFKIRVNYPSKDDKIRNNPAYYEYQGK